MNVDWIALQDRLTAAEAALKTAETDIYTLTVLVTAFRSSLLDLATEGGTNLSRSSFGMLDALIRSALRPEITARIDLLEDEHRKLRATI